MKALLTGSTGFVGMSLRKYFLRTGTESTYLDRKPVDPNGIAWEHISAVSDLVVDAIIHLAGKAHDTSNTSAPEEYFSINTGLTKQLFDEFLQSSARDFIYFSSVKAAADTVAGVLDEEVIPDPRTPYGQSKRKAEEYILAHNLPVEKRVIILRPCMIHGPGNKGNLNLLFKMVQKGLPWPLAAFNNKRSFLSIDNLCFLLEKIIENRDVPSGVYNCADDESVATNELVALIGESMGKKPKFWHLPPLMIKKMATVGDTIHFPLNSERLKKLTESYVVSNRKLKDTLGIERLPLAAKEGLRKTFNSFSS